MVREQEVLGLIAGQGRLPFLIARGAKQAGLKVVCVGLVDNAESSLADEVDVFCRAGIARPGSWIRKLRKHGVTRTVMVGGCQGAHFYAMADCAVFAGLAGDSDVVLAASC